MKIASGITSKKVAMRALSSSTRLRSVMSCRMATKTRRSLTKASFKVNSKEDVDTFTKEFLNKNKIKTLYNTPRLFPEYTKDYYAVFFEDPDRIKLEVTYKM